MMKDEQLIRRCIDLAEAALDTGEPPFASVITKDNRIIAEAASNTIKSKDLTQHAEIIVIKKARQLLQSSDFSACTLYSNCEPCPMCACMIREHKVKRVVFAVQSPIMGGYSRWDILQDTGLATPHEKRLSKGWLLYSKPSEIVAGLLEAEAAKTFIRRAKFLKH